MTPARSRRPAALLACAARLGLVLAVLGTTASAAADASRPLVIDDGADAYDLFAHISIVADPRGVLRPADVVARAPEDLGDVDPGPAGAVWLRVAIDARSTPREPWFLSVAPPFDPATIFAPEHGGWTRTTLGPRAEPVLVPIAIERGTQWLLLRLPRIGSAPPIVALTTRRGHDRLHGRLLVTQSLFLGALLAMAFVNVALLAWARERAQLWYLAFVVATAGYFAVHMGMLSRFVVPSVSASDLVLPEMSLLAAMAMTGAQLARHLLDTTRASRRSDLALQIYTVFVALVLVIMWIVPGANAAMKVVGMLLPVVAITAGVATWRTGSRWVRLYLAGVIAFALGAFLHAAPLPLPQGVGSDAFQIGCAMEVAFLALALVDRFRTLRVELARAQSDLARADRLATLGQLVAAVAHEVNNPNSFISFNLPMLREYIDAMRPHVESSAPADATLCGLPRDEFFRDLTALVANMEHGSSRITAIVSELKRYARADETCEPTDVNVIVDRAARLVRKQLETTVDRFEVRCARDLPRVNVAAGRIEQVVVNLLVNAGQASAGTDGSSVVVTTERTADAVVVVVEDSGPGVPASIQDRIFEPFFTTKGADVGTGLGLAIARRIVDDHDGTLELQSRPGAPTRFVLRLPFDVREGAGNP